MGVTPVTAPSIKAGNHRVNLSAQGYDGIAENIDVNKMLIPIIPGYMNVR